VETRRSAAYVPGLGFDRLTALYDPVVRLTTRERAFKDRLLAQAALSPGERVLDLGCGTGTLALQAKRCHPSASVYGVDGDPAVLVRARRKADAEALAVSFDEGLADRLPYRDGVVDKVLSSLVFHHLDRETKELAALEVARVLRPGGELHVADWGPPRGLLGPLLFLPIRLLDGWERADNAAGRLPEIFTASGLRDVRRHGRLQTPLGALTLLSARRP